MDLAIQENKSPHILLYHKISRRWDSGIGWVTPNRFRRQLKITAQEGWQPVTPSEWCADGRNKRFILAFDDGYGCLAENFLRDDCNPLIKGIIFIPTAFIGRENDWDHRMFGRRFRHLNKVEIRQFVDYGWEIGSHSVTHRPLTHLTDAELISELALSKERLEEVTNRRIKWVSYPFGRYDDRCIELSAELGYSGAIVPVDRRVKALPNFYLWRADAVYWWDSPHIVMVRLKRGRGYAIDYQLRRGINYLAGGTSLWNGLFRKRLSCRG